MRLLRCSTMLVAVLTSAIASAAPVPNVPVIFEDGWYEGDDLAKLCDGVDLHFVVLPEAEGKYLWAFATEAERDAFVGAGNSPEGICGNSCFYEHDIGNGCGWCLEGADSNLTDNSCGSGSWNDIISSVLTAGCGAILYQNVSFGGSSLWLYSYGTFPYPLPGGFNDITSSFKAP